MTRDPFEAAAEREEHEELRREVQKEAVLSRLRLGGKKGEESGMPGRVLILPYIAWALYRAGDHRWGGPSLSDALKDFFFGYRWFSIASVIVALCVWVWFMRIDDDKE